MKRYGFLLTVIACIYSSVVCSNVFEDVVIELDPVAPQSKQDIFFEINKICGDLENNIFVESKVLDGVNRIEITNAFHSCTDSEISSSVRVPLGQLGVGFYRIIYRCLNRNRPVGSFEVLEFSVVDLLIEPVDSSFHESPAQNSLQSGIGLIRGWACNATKVEISMDEGEKLLVPYGGTRGDTAEVCNNDGFNGYAMAYAWGLLTDGLHRMQTYVDDVEIADVQFSTVRVDEGFLRREDAEYTLPDFPVTGQQVTIRWRDDLQNFSVISKPEPITQ